MGTIKLNTKAIKDFEEEVDKRVKSILENEFDKYLEKYLSKHGLRIEDIKEKINKPTIKAIY